MATVVKTTRPDMMGTATLVIRPVMTETLTMVAIMGMLLLQMGIGTMLEWSNRRKEGYSCNVIEAFVFSLSWRCKVIALTLAMIGRIDLVL